LNFRDIVQLAINEKRKLRVTFFSKEDNTQLVRICAPFDIGPSRKFRDKTERYHLWDYDSDEQSHTLPLLDAQVSNIELLEEHFEPQSLITWNFKPNNWFYPRNWGNYS